MTDGPLVAGVDGCRAGWVAAVLDGNKVTAHYVERIDRLVAVVSNHGIPEVVGIDIPIGLPDNSRRSCDALARKMLGPRGSSVFTTPTRAAIDSAEQAAASAANRILTGDGVSAQAFAIAPKIREVDMWVQNAEVRVVEVHPEVSFAALNGEPMRSPKKTWDGLQTRRRTLERAGIEIPDDLGRAGQMAAADDVLDAIVAAWSARRVAMGQAQCVPQPPEVFSDGIPAAIWF
jgi:predicted RNase H-like nuclease